MKHDKNNLEQIYPPENVITYDRFLIKISGFSEHQRLLRIRRDAPHPAGPLPGELLGPLRRGRPPQLRHPLHPDDAAATG